MSSSRSSRTNILQVEPEGLYLVLSALAGKKNKWHWGLYLAYDELNGRTFHIIDRNDKWKYESKDTNRMTYSEKVVVALKIAVIDKDMQPGFKDRVKAVSISQGDTCRTWVLEAMRQLDEEGWISLTASTHYLEEEAIDAAMENQDRNVRSVKKSALCRR